MWAGHPTLGRPAHTHTLCKTFASTNLTNSEISIAKPSLSSCTFTHPLILFLRFDRIDQFLILRVEKLFNLKMKKLGMCMWQGCSWPHATQVAFIGAHYCRADGTFCHASGSSSSVSVDGWFILGAMITGVQPHPARVQPVWLRPGEAVNQPSTAHTPHTPSTVDLVFLINQFIK